MRLTFVADFGATTYTIEIDPKMELENVMALLEAEVSDFLQGEFLASRLSSRQVRHPLLRAKYLV